MAPQQETTPTRARSVLDGFDARVAKAPDEPAVIGDGRSLTYRELDAAAERMARELRRRKVGPETVVGLALERGVELAVAVLAIGKAGGAYLPLDPEHPAERARHALADAGARLVVTQTAVSRHLDADGWGGIEVLTIDHADAAAVHADDDGDAVGLEGAVDGTAVAGEADQLLYVIYTSGSTGRPKGIAMHCGPQITLLDWCREHYAERPVALQYFPITADVAYLELMSTWWLGGCVVIATARERYDMAALTALVERHRVDKALLPVAVLDELARHTQDDPAPLRTLRQLITTGDRLVITPAIRDLCGRLPEVALDNHYGSTEVNVVTAPRLTAPAEEWPQQPAIGTPMSQARIYVLDAHLNPVPPRAQGEIYVGGGPLARGYAGRAALTAAAFLPDPFGTAPGARMYRTGDLGRWKAGGVLEYLGRADFQIKLHGYRVEPGEIEALLRDRDDVERAVVIRLGEGQQAFLAAYLVAAGDPANGTTPAELREYLGERLPAHMIPSSFTYLPEFPMTGTGKIDRKALPRPETAEPQWTAPRDEAEKAVAGIFADVLGLRRIGVEDNFFRLGGHSLLITQVVHRLNSACGVRVPLQAVFERPTAAALAEEVRRLQAERS